MTYAQLLDRSISDGIAEVREAYADPARVLRSLGTRRVRGQ